jgi:hypothetical protein
MSLGMIHLDFVYICCIIRSVMAFYLRLSAWNATAVSTREIDLDSLLVVHSRL